MRKGEISPVGIKKTRALHSSKPPHSHPGVAFCHHSPSAPPSTLTFLHGTCSHLRLGVRDKSGPSSTPQSSPEGNSRGTSWQPHISGAARRSKRHKCHISLSSHQWLHLTSRIPRAADTEQCHFCRESWEHRHFSTAPRRMSFSSDKL